MHINYLPPPSELSARRTIVVHIRVAGVSNPVLVRVPLFDVGHIGAVVARVPGLVRVSVQLVRVGQERAVVLAQRRRYTVELS